MVFQKWVVQSWPVCVGSDSCPRGTWGSWPRWGIDISKLCLLFSFCISLSPWIYFHTYSTTPTEQYNMGEKRLAYVYNEMPVFSRIQWKRGWLLSIASGRWWLHFLSDRQSCPWKSTENSAFCSGPWENEIHVNPWYHFQDFKGKSTINGLLFHCLSLKCQGSLGWVLSQSLFSFYLTTCLQAISLLLISPFMNLLIIPGLLDRSLSDCVHRTRKPLLPHALPVINCVAEKGPITHPGVTPDTSAGLAGIFGHHLLAFNVLEVCCVTDTPKSQRLQVFSSLVLCVGCQSAGRRYHQLLQTGWGTSCKHSF